ncbi:MAG: hypothetical protein AABX32_03470 [Nanoarchaeota archaeon]
MSRTSKEDAKNILSNVPEDKVFWLNNGGVLRNLQELSSALADISEETFGYYVNNEKNDFKNWVNDVIGDKKLADEIAKTKSKEHLLSRVNKRINQLNTLIK